MESNIIQFPTALRERTTPQPRSTIRTRRSACVINSDEVEWLEDICNFLDNHVLRPGKMARPVKENLRTYAETLREITADLAARMI